MLTSTTAVSPTARRGEGGGGDVNHWDHRNQHGPSPHPRNTGTPADIPTQAEIDSHPHLLGVKIPEHSRKEVDLLIWVGESELQHTYAAKTAKSEELWALLSGLGWVVHGRDSLE